MTDTQGGHIADYEREELQALIDADTLHMLPVPALIASIKDLARRLLAALNDGPAPTWEVDETLEMFDEGTKRQAELNDGQDAPVSDAGKLEP